MVTASKTIHNPEMKRTSHTTLKPYDYTKYIFLINSLDSANETVSKDSMTSVWASEE